MTDLTKIDEPFGELDRDTKVALFAARVDGQTIEYRNAVDPHWTIVRHPSWTDWSLYRVRPEPVTQDSIDWSDVVPEFVAMVRHGVGKATLTTERDMYIRNVEWWSDNPTCRWIDASTFTSYKRGTCDWTDSLVLRP